MESLQGILMIRALLKGSGLPRNPGDECHENFFMGNVRASVAKEVHQSLGLFSICQVRSVKILSVLSSKLYVMPLPRFHPGILLDL